MSFTKKIIVSMILGIVIGIAFNLTDLIESALGDYITDLRFDLLYFFIIIKTNYNTTNIFLDCMWHYLIIR